MIQGEHSAILLTLIKLPFVIKIFVLSIFEGPLKMGFYCIAVYSLFVVVPMVYMGFVLGCSSLSEVETAGFLFNLFLLSRNCVCFVLPFGGTMGESVVSDQGIFWSHLLFFS